LYFHFTLHLISVSEHLFNIEQMSDNGDFDTMHKLFAGTSSHTQHSHPHTQGLVIHGLARFYDLLAMVLLRGSEAAFRRKMVDLAQVKLGEAVLDVGCGTGSLLIAAKKRIGVDGKAFGIDPSPEMIAVARRKAVRQNADIEFTQGVAESLPYADAMFDAVFCTLMLHHLPDSLRPACVHEMRRVLKPGGRVFAVDFGNSGKRQHGLLAHFSHGHGSFKAEDMKKLFSEEGFAIAGEGPMGKADLHYVLARA
jgi:ubiquinone/menaquinone biosynthesis C-methylase UbiE